MAAVVVNLAVAAVAVLAEVDLVVAMVAAVDTKVVAGYGTNTVLYKYYLSSGIINEASPTRDASLFSSPKGWHVWVKSVADQQFLFDQQRFSQSSIM